MAARTRAQRHDRTANVDGPTGTGAGIGAAAAVAGAAVAGAAAAPPQSPGSDETAAEREATVSASE